MKNTHESAECAEWTTETELSRLTGKSRDWCRPRLRNIRRDDQGRLPREESLRALGHCEIPNPFRWVAEKASRNFLTTAFRSEISDMWNDLFPDRTQEEVEDTAAAVLAYLWMIREGWIDNDMFSKQIAADSDGEDIDAFARKMLPGNVIFRRGRACDNDDDVSFPSWLIPAVERREKRSKKRRAR